MAAEPDDDARRTLAELEARLRDLEQELLGEDPPAEPEPGAAEPARDTVDAGALADARAAADALAGTLASLAAASAEIRAHALELGREQGAMASAEPEPEPEPVAATPAEPSRLAPAAPRSGVPVIALVAAAIVLLAAGAAAAVWLTT